MNGNSRPRTKLMLPHVQGVANDREDEKGNGIENEDSTQGNRHILVLGLQHRTDSGNGTASADCGAGRNKIGRISAHLQALASDEPTDEQRTYHGQDGKLHAFLPGSQRGVQVHAKAQTDHRILQQILGHLLIELRMGLSAEERESQSQEQSHRRSNPRDIGSHSGHIIQHQATKENGQDGHINSLAMGLQQILFCSH